MNTFELIRAIVYGHAIADALGVPVEFKSRESLKKNPVTDMRGYGTYGMPAGTWSDDTTMALATLDSLSHGINLDDLMTRFCEWEQHAAYTATDEVFDMGVTTGRALRRYLNGSSVEECGCTDGNSNGNGSLMRIYSVVLYCCLLHPEDYSTEAMIDLVHRYSAVTHGHPISQMGCGIYAFVLRALLRNPTAESVMSALQEAQTFYKVHPYQRYLHHYTRLFAPDFPAIPVDDIQSGGYVVSSLEAAVWCLLNSSSYPECVLKAVNLGRDTDTVGAITGSMAAVLFGPDDVPAQWMDTLLKKDFIDEICRSFAGDISA